MADKKIGVNGVARRSARTFESDFDVGQPQLYTTETISVYKKSRKEGSEQSYEKKTTEKIGRSRGSSFSSMAAASNDEVYLSGFESLARQISTEEEVTTVQTEVKKEKKPKTPGRPRNFGRVATGIYRSGYPEADDHEFLKELGLRTIVTLVDKDYPEGYQTFMEMNGIKHVHVKMEGTKKSAISDETVASILNVILDKENHPVLMHCNQGRHRTGCVVAAIRNVMGWSVDSIVQEYTTFAEPKVREVDVKWIYRFQSSDGADITKTHEQRMMVGPKPRRITKPLKMVKMVIAALILLVFLVLTYLHAQSKFLLA